MLHNSFKQQVTFSNAFRHKVDITIKFLIFKPFAVNFASSRQQRWSLLGLATTKQGNWVGSLLRRGNLKQLVFCTFVTNFRAVTQTDLCNMFTRIGYSKKGEPLPWFEQTNRKPKGSSSNILKTPYITGKVMLSQRYFKSLVLCGSWFCNRFLMFDKILTSKMPLNR